MPIVKHNTTAAEYTISSILGFGMILLKISGIPMAEISPPAAGSEIAGRISSRCSIRELIPAENILFMLEVSSYTS